jgi:hypothetical protein
MGWFWIQAREEWVGNKFPQVRACANPVPTVHLGNKLALFSLIDDTFELGPLGRRWFPKFNKGTWSRYRGTSFVAQSFRPVAAETGREIPVGPATRWAGTSPETASSQTGIVGLLVIHQLAQPSPY